MNTYPKHDKKTYNDYAAQSKPSSFCYVSSLILIAVAAGLLIAARTVPGFAEWYSVTIYPVLVSTVGRVTGSFSFSVAEMICLALPLILLISIIRNYRHIGTFFRRLLLFAAVLIFLYTANCGINYYRDPFVDQKVYSEASFTVDQLADFCEYAAEQLSDNTDSEAGSEDNAFIYPGSAEIAETAVEAMTALSNKAVVDLDDLGIHISHLSGYYPHPKKLMVLSPLFSKMGVSGIYSPFTIEANTNGEMPGMEQPFTACHELSHLRSYMNEGEANFIGWLACIGSDDPAFNRSAWLIAWSYAGNALYKADPERYEEVLKKLPESALRELSDNHEFWQSHETKASEIQDRVNDAYLKSSGQTDGIASYGKLTTLMLSWYCLR